MTLDKVLIKNFMVIGFLNLGEFGANWQAAVSHKSVA